MRTRIALAAATIAALSLSITSMSLAGVASGVVHRLAARRRTRQDVDAPAASSRTRAIAAHTVQMERAVANWRTAHPLVMAPPKPAPAPVVSTDATSTTTTDWACIREHESGDRYNTPAAPGGAYGFLESTWLSLGYGGWPYEAPPSVQDRAVLYLYNELGWQPWSTRTVCGL
jgi:Transglycosylase-like domain